MEPPIASSAGPVSDSSKVVTNHSGATERVFNMREQGETGSTPRGPVSYTHLRAHETGAYR
eukprot:792893-Pyramimonas_sp.AAC.1